MSTIDFNRIADVFAKTRLSRRRAVSASALGFGGAITGFTASRSSAQDATPIPATHTTPSATDDTSFLFVQSATSGTFTPNPAAGTPTASGTPTPGGGASFLLTLEGHTGGTIYFSDRPERIFGDAPTQKFLDGLGFSPVNPPNAAIVTQTDDGSEDVLVVELLNPVYDEETSTLTYGATVLTAYTGDGLAYVAQQQQDDSLPASFGRTSLFIDDCSDSNPLQCYTSCSAPPAGNLGDRGMCWEWSDFECVPCSGGWSGTAAECNADFAACNGSCFTDTSSCPHMT